MVQGHVRGRQRVTFGFGSTTHWIWLNTHAVFAVSGWRGTHAPRCCCATSSGASCETSGACRPACRGAATAGEGAKQGMSCFCPASFGRVRHGVLNLPSSSSGGNGTQHVGSASISGSEVGHRTGVCLDGVCESGIQPGRFAPGGAVCHPLHAAYVTADLILIGFSWTC